jgi:hypothetical protein
MTKLHAFVRLAACNESHIGDSVILDPPPEFELSKV